MRLLVCLLLFSAGILAIEPVWADDDCPTPAQRAGFAVDARSPADISAITPEAAKIIQGMSNDLGADLLWDYFFYYKVDKPEQLLQQLTPEQSAQIFDAMKKVQPNLRPPILKTKTPQNLESLFRDVTADQVEKIGDKTFDALLSSKLTTQQVAILSANQALMQAWATSQVPAVVPPAVAAAPRTTQDLMATLATDAASRGYLVQLIHGAGSYSNLVIQLLQSMNDDQATAVQASLADADYFKIFDKASPGQIYVLWVEMENQDDDYKNMGVLVDALPDLLPKQMLQRLTDDQLLAFLDVIKEDAAAAGNPAPITGLSLSGTDDEKMVEKAAATAVKIAPNAAPQTPPPTEAVIVQGLADFIDARAKAEVEEFFTDKVLETLCANQSDPMLAHAFSQTCLLDHQMTQPTALGVGNTTTALVNALRADMREIPSCAVYRSKHSIIGYQLESIYEQHENGVQIEQLIYGLATSSNFNKTISAKPANLCTYTAPKPGSPPGSSGFQGDMCGVVVPILAYAASLQALPFALKKAPPEPGADLKSTSYLPPADWGIDAKDKLGRQFQQELFVGTYAYEFEQLAIENGMPDLATRIDTWFGGLSDSDMQNAAIQLYRFFTLRQQIATQIQLLNQPQKPLERPQVVEGLIKIADVTLDQMYDSVRVPMDDGDQTFVLGAMDLMSDLNGTYANMEAREYSAAMMKIAPLLECTISLVDQTEEDQKRSGADNPIVTKPSFCADSWNSDEKLSKMVVHFEAVDSAVSALADAKSADDFSATLDQLASPVDAWKLRHTGNVLALSSVAGLGVGWTNYSIPNHRSVSDNGFYSINAPVGISFTRPCGNEGAWGGLVSILDVGNLIGQPSSVSFPGGRISGTVQSSLSNVFTPGFYVLVAPWKSPWTFYAGISKGPTDYRQVIFQNGSTAQASRGVTYTIGIGVDIIIFRL